MRYKKPLGALIPILLPAILLAGCGSDLIRSPKPQSDWSRGLRVGFAAGLTQPSLLVESDGTAHIAWTSDTALNSGEIGYSRISRSGEQTVRSMFEIPERHLRGTALRQVDSSVEFCWNSDPGVSCAALDAAGEELLQPFLLIPSPPNVLTYSLAGESYAWVDEEQDLFVSNQGQAPVHLAQDVLNVNLSQQGDQLIAAWSSASSESETTFWVARIDKQEIETPHQVSRLTSGITAGLRQVGLGTVRDGDDVCMVYGYEFTQGLEGGTAATEIYCVNQQSWQLVAGNALELTIPQRITYQEYGGPFALTRIAAPEIPSSTFTYLPSSPIASEGQIALLVSTPAIYRYQSEQQIALLLVERSRIIGYQPVSATTSASLFPNLAQDGAGNLYAAWLERGTGKDIYFSTTSSAAATALNPLTLGEVTVEVIGVVVEAVTGLFLLPFALLWVVAAFVVYFIVATVGRWVRLQVWGERLAFLAGMITLWISKLLFLPQMTSFLPFGDYMPELDPGLRSTLMIFWPLFILGLSLYLARVIVKRREIESMPIHFGLYAIIDIVLTALLYGAMLQGAGG
ncbi:MAG: hypothetical protein P8X64_07845 [Anaerolineales bacterium]